MNISETALQQTSNKCCPKHIYVPLLGMKSHLLIYIILCVNPHIPAGLRSRCRKVERNVFISADPAQILS